MPGAVQPSKPVRDFWVTVHGPRAATFEQVYGTTTVAVRTPAPHLAHLPGFDEPQPVYLLDLDWLDEIGRRQQLIEYAARRFGHDPADVAANIDHEGMPILADDTILRIDHPQRWLTDDIWPDDDGDWG